MQMTEDQKQLIRDKVEEAIANGVTDKVTLDSLDLLVEGVKNLYEINKELKPSGDEVLVNKIWNEYKDLFGEFATTLTNLKYKYVLTLSEWKKIKDIILNKAEYDLQNIVVAQKLKDDLFYKKDNDLFHKNNNFIATIELDVHTAFNITLCLNLYKFRGVEEGVKDFTKAFDKAAIITRIHQVYAAKMDEIKEPIENWIIGLEASPIIENSDVVVESDTK